MKPLVVSHRARADLRNIHAYIARDSPEAARRFSADLVAKTRWIAQVDFTGSPRDEISPGLRGFPYRKRCIYYRSYPDRVVLIRVLHMAQEFAGIDFD